MFATTSITSNMSMDKNYYERFFRLYMNNKVMNYSQNEKRASRNTKLIGDKLDTEKDYTEEMHDIKNPD